MKVRSIRKSWKHVAAVIVFGSAMFALGTGKAYAQWHDQRHERADFKHHQRDERRYYGGWAVRDHQRAEKHAFRDEEHHEREGYYGGNYGRYGYPYGGYQYPSGQGNAYPPAYGGYGYPNGHTDHNDYYPDQYHGNQLFGQGAHDPHHEGDHH